MNITLELQNDCLENISLYDLLIHPQIFIKEDSFYISKYNDISLDNKIELEEINPLFNLNIELNENNFEEVKSKVISSEIETIIYFLKKELGKEYIDRNTYALNEYNDFNSNVKIYYTNGINLIDIYTEGVLTKDLIKISNLIDVDYEELKKYNKLYIANIDNRMFKKILVDNFEEKTLRYKSKNGFDDFISQEVNSMLNIISFLIDDLMNSIPESKYNFIFAKYLALNLDEYY